MDPVTTGLMAVNVVGSLLGGLGASKARRRAEQARARALQDYLIAGDAGLQAMRQANAQGLWQAAGQGGDALRALGGRLGAALAAAGVYNSSATAGALQRAQEAQAASLADLAARNYAAEAQLQAQLRQQALAQQMGWAAQDVGYLRDQEAAARQGLISGLVGLAQAFNKPAAATQPAATQPQQQAAPPASVLNAQPLTAPTLALATPRTVQPLIQTYQRDWRNLFAFPEVRTRIPSVPGAQGSVLPGVRAPRAPRVLYQPLRLG